MEATPEPVALPGCFWAASRVIPGRQHTRVQSITEAMPPEVPARPSLTLPPDINQFPFSSFISIGFQVGSQASALLAAAHVSPDTSPQTGRSCVCPSFSNLLLHLLLWGLWMQLCCSENLSNPHFTLLLLIRDATPLLHLWHHPAIER